MNYTKNVVLPIFVWPKSRPRGTPAWQLAEAFSWTLAADHPHSSQRSKRCSEPMWCDRACQLLKREGVHIFMFHFRRKPHKIIPFETLTSRILNI